MLDEDAERPTILVVDDSPDNLWVVGGLLQSAYRVRAAPSGHRALEVVETDPRPDLILLDVMMPEMDGYECLRRLRESPRARDIPVIFVTALDSQEDERLGLELGAVDYLAKPVRAAILLARVKNHLELARMRRSLRLRNEDLERTVLERSQRIGEQARELERRSRSLIAAQDATILAFCALAEARDNETGNHIWRTQHYLLALSQRARRLPRFQAALDDDTIQLLFKSAPLHDIGKVAVPDAILLKPGPLTADEFEVMKRHCEWGRAAIARAMAGLPDIETEFLRHAIDIAFCHHEHWDGSGYPRGLAGEAIPLSARLMGIADVYDALVTKRVYKAPVVHELAVAAMAAGRGTHFDPDLVDAMLAIADEFHNLALRYPDHDDAPLS